SAPASAFDSTHHSLAFSTVFCHPISLRRRSSLLFLHQSLDIAPAFILSPAFTLSPALCPRTSLPFYHRPSLLPPALYSRTSPLFAHQSLSSFQPSVLLADISSPTSLLFSHQSSVSASASCSPTRLLFSRQSSVLGSVFGPLSAHLPSAL